jgi:small subunit ribosomal protein S6
MEHQLYELAYHIEPEVIETDLPQMKADIEKLITDQGGNIVYSKDPEKTRLSYEIKHERMSYFGFSHFHMENKDGIAHVDEQLRLNNHIMRHLIIKVDERRQTQSKLPSGTPDRRTKRDTVVKKVENKDLEKQLEDVISGL